MVRQLTQVGTGLGTRVISPAAHDQIERTVRTKLSGRVVTEAIRRAGIDALEADILKEAGKIIDRLSTSLEASTGSVERERNTWRANYNVEHLKSLMQKHHGNVVAAASEADMEPQQLMSIIGENPDVFSK